MEKNTSPKDLTSLSDCDIIDMYIRCVGVFTEVSSKLDLERRACFGLGQELWEKSIKARDEYRKGYSK